MNLVGYLHKPEGLPVYQAYLRTNEYLPMELADTKKKQNKASYTVSVDKGGQPVNICYLII